MFPKAGNWSKLTNAVVEESKKIRTKRCLLDLKPRSELVTVTKAVSLKW